MRRDLIERIQLCVCWCMSICMCDQNSGKTGNKKSKRKQKSGEMCFFMSFPSHDNERKTNIENFVPKIFYADFFLHKSYFGYEFVLGNSRYLTLSN